MSRHQRHRDRKSLKDCSSIWSWSKKKSEHLSQHVMDQKFAKRISLSVEAISFNSYLHEISAVSQVTRRWDPRCRCSCQSPRWAAFGSWRKTLGRSGLVRYRSGDDETMMTITGATRFHPRGSTSTTPEVLGFVGCFPSRMDTFYSIGGGDVGK